MARFVFTLAVSVSAVVFGLIIATDIGAAFDRIAYRQQCIISAAMLAADEPITACGQTR